jgi:hypothetical protein
VDAVSVLLPGPDAQGNPDPVIEHLLGIG